MIGLLKHDRDITLIERNDTEKCAIYVKGLNGSDTLEE